MTRLSASVVALARVGEREVDVAEVEEVGVRAGIGGGVEDGDGGGHTAKFERREFTRAGLRAGSDGARLPAQSHKR